MSVAEFQHNFCESRAFGGGPEILNSLSSLFITILPFFYDLPKIMSLRRVIYVLMFTGITSSYYPFNLNWFGKQLDELGMILALYIGTIEELNLFNRPYPKQIYHILDIYFTFLFTAKYVFHSFWRF